MGIITGIYVIATIIICWANIKSANASKEQLEEMQKQYAETNRPLIELEFQYQTLQRRDCQHGSADESLQGTGM